MNFRHQFACTLCVLYTYSLSFLLDSLPPHETSHPAHRHAPGARQAGVSLAPCFTDQLLPF